MSWDDEAAEASPADDDGAFIVWPENRRALELFLALRTQWRRAGMEGEAVGLDYGAIPATARMMGVKMTPALFDDIRDMEDEALKAWRARRERERPRQ